MSTGFGEFIAHPDDGRVVATGSVWKLYFPDVTQVPNEEQVARALAELGVVKAQRAVVTGEARVTPTIIEQKEI